MKSLHRSGDFLVALVALAIGAAALASVPSEVGGETLAAIGDMNSPAFFPILAALVMLLCSTVLVVRAIADARAGKSLEIEFGRRAVVLTVMCLFALFAIATYYVGMLPSAVVTIIIMAALLGYRNPRVLIPVAIALPASIYFLFERLLLILLPRGELFQ